jgi:probable rRNA maturation factor
MVMRYINLNRFIIEQLWPKLFYCVAMNLPVQSRVTLVINKLMETRLNIVTSCNKWQFLTSITDELISEILRLTLTRFKNFQSIRLVELSILLTNNSYMRMLNRKYLGKDKPTNVLSFQEFAFDYKNIKDVSIQKDVVFLGNIAFGYQILLREAQEKAITVTNHFAHLLIHGILHLLGFDHNTHEEAEAMESLEQEILSQFCQTIHK